MTSTTNYTESDMGNESSSQRDPLHPVASNFSPDTDYGGGMDGEYGTGVMGSESAMSFSITNTQFEFSRLNHCIEISRKIGEISVDDAETLVFFLELVREALTNKRCPNA